MKQSGYADVYRIYKNFYKESGKPERIADLLKMVL